MKVKKRRKWNEGKEKIEKKEHRMEKGDIWINS